jgi:hypothetical protein
MASITPVAYKTGGGSIAGTTKYGNLYVGTSQLDYGVVGQDNGVVFYSTPNEDLGYVIAHEDPTGGHNGKPGNVPAYMGFWRSEFLTENSFVELVNGLYNQSFTGGTDAKNYLNSNNIWTSYTPKTPFNELQTIAEYLRNYMSDFRNPSFYAYQLDGNGYSISDGGGDMYDDGNISSPWIVANTEYISDGGYSPGAYPFAVDYTQSATTQTLDTSFGYISLGYQQFTGGIQSLTYLPLTVLGSRDNETYGPNLPVGFQTGGNSGADGGGTLASGTIYSGQTVSGFTVYAFFRETYNASDPSHCDLYILLGHPNWNSTFGTVSSFAQPVNVGGCGGYLYTTGAGTQNILSIKTLLSKNGGALVSQAECQTVVNNFILRVKESQNF